MRTLGPKGTALIKSFEELRLVAYRKFPGEPWTCGWGHTGPDVTEGTTCTADQAEVWFQCDIARPERAVNLMTKQDLTQCEFDALVSFAYNVGVGAESHSTLIKLVNAGHFAAAADQFLQWDHVNGVESEGLKRRREAERTLFLTED